MLKIILTTWLFFSLSSIASAVENKRGNFKSIREVPIKENGEPLIDLKEQIIIAYDASFLLENPECTKVRKTVYEKLCEAQKLLSSGMRFELSVGLRSLQVQDKMFKEMYKEVQKKYPQMSEKELFLETSKFVVPVRTWEGIQNTPPHSTGGAIDILLIDQEGKQIDMGVNVVDPNQEELLRTDSPHISVEARKNRDIMAKALSAVGFVNYPAEFWHWSYGDRRWAFVTGAPYSIYGPILENDRYF